MTGDPYCVDCVFFEVNLAHPSLGLCRRYAPRAAVVLNGNARVVWPEVSRNDWCGEFQAEEPPKDPA